MITKLTKTIRTKARDFSFGLVHIITGDGKGKTTASLGLAVRALGYNKKVHMISFMKSGITGEQKASLKSPGFVLELFGKEAMESKIQTEQEFTFLPDEVEKEAIRLGIKRAEEVLKSNKVNVLILDEILVAVAKSLVEESTVIELTELARKNNIELILTGRDCPESLYNYADYVSQINKIKHPYPRILARKGVEY